MNTRFVLVFSLGLLFVFFGLNLFLLDLSPQAIQAAAVTSVKSGNWSDPAVWSTGAVPGASDSVTISAGHIVTYNVADSRVAGVTVADSAKLVFAPTQTLVLRTDKNILVRGELEMRPSAATVNHTIRFVDVDELKFVGGGVNVLDTDIGLWVRGNGLLDIAGSPKTAWTRLQGSANAGNTTITLQAAPTGWRVGDEISIVPTEHPSVGNDSWNGFELRTITAVSSNVVTLNAPLSRNHPAAVDPFSGKKYTAEVLNLSRNVHIEGTGDGSADPAKNGRAHVQILSGVPQFVSYAELKLLGPRTAVGSDPRGTGNVLGRYGLHFHHSGDGARGSLVEGVVVRNAGNHAFVPHNSHGITLRDTIAYDTWEDAYWWDPPVAGPTKSGADAIRLHTANNSNDTLFDHAVAAIVKFDPSFSGSRLSGFVLGAGSGNGIRNSVAVGVQGNGDANGFHWPQDANQNVGGLVWEFNQGNIAHNNKVHGIFTWQNDFNNHIIQDFVAYNNKDSAIDHGAYINNYQYIDITAFGNAGQGILAMTAFGNGLQAHANAPATGNFRTDGYTLVFERYKTTGSLLFPKHNANTAMPTLFKDCVFAGVFVNDTTDNGKIPTKADFVNCTKPNGQSLEPADFTLQGAVPGLDIRVQRPNGTAFRIENGGVVTTIAPFYAAGPITPPDPDPTATFSAAPASITQGQSATLTWSSTDATTCQGVNFTTGGATSGSVTVSPTQTTTYDLICSNATKSVVKSVTVLVSLPAPTASLSASASSISAGQSVTLSWTSANATQCTGTNFSTAGATSGSVAVSPILTTTYTLQCIQPGLSSNDPTLTASDSTTVSVAGGSLIPTITSLSRLHLFLDKLSKITLTGTNFDPLQIFRFRMKNSTGTVKIDIPITPINSTTIEIDFIIQSVTSSTLPPDKYEIELESSGGIATKANFVVTKLGDLWSQNAKASDPEPRDGKIDIHDVTRMLSTFGKAAGATGFNQEADINPGPANVSSGKVDIFDANKLMANWTGSSVGTPGWHPQATTMIEGVDAADHCVAWPSNGFPVPRYRSLIDPSTDWIVGTTDWGTGLGNAPRYSNWYDCTTSANTDPNASPPWMGYPGITHMHMTNSGKLSPYLSSSNHVPIVGFYWYSGDVNFTANTASAAAFIQSAADNTRAAGKKFVIGLDGTLSNLGQLAAPADYILVNHSAACQAGTLGFATDQLLADLSAAGATGQLAVGFTIGQSFLPVAVNGVSPAAAQSCFAELKNRGVRAWLIDHPIDPSQIDEFHRQNRGVTIPPSPLRTTPFWPPPGTP